MLDIGKKEKIVLTFLKFGPILGRKRFQKMMFLAKMKYMLDIPFIFVKYHYGPYSKDLQETLDRLANFGLILEKSKKIDNFKAVYEYRLTKKGEIIIEIDPLSYEKEIKNILEVYKAKSTDELVKEAYKYV